jgi:hypothetical protein
MSGGSLEGDISVGLGDAYFASVASVLLMWMLWKLVFCGLRWEIEGWWRIYWHVEEMMVGEEQYVMYCPGCGRSARRCGDERAAYWWWWWWLRCGGGGVVVVWW